MAGRDPRAMLLAAAGSVLLISSTEPGEVLPFLAYAPLAAGLAAGARVSWAALISRVMLGAPFIVLAAAMFALGAGWERAVSAALKGFCCLTLIVTLSLATPIPQLLWALRRLGAPSVVNMISGLMLRYIDMLQEEFSRMQRARLSRCGRPVGGLWLFQSHGAMIGTLLLRSWERADRIHAAMISRGFSGLMPDTRLHRWRTADSVLLLGALGAFTAARLFL
jgi:cobalt/nickel transport system permease protein